MIFIPLGLAAAAVALFFIGRSQAAKASDIASTETSLATDVAREADDVAKEIGAGSYAKVAEIKGVVECGAPLASEMAGVPCVWYSSTVTREYEERYTERDSDGKTRTGTRRGSEQVSRSERRVPFMVRDQSGAIEVDPEGAPMDGQKVLSRFEPGDRGPSISIGSFSVSLGALAGGRRTIGYRLEERAMPIGARVYVLGEAKDEGGRLRVAKPSAKGGRFIISGKSEEELLKSAKTGSSVLFALAAALAAGTVATLALVLTGVI